MIELVTTDGIFALDGGEWEVTNNIWLVGDLAEAVDAPVWLHPDDRMLWDVVHPSRPPDRELAGGLVLPVGDGELAVLHTPGHSPGCCCFHLTEGSRGDAVFSGDTLFCGGPGTTGRSFSDFPTIVESIRRKLLRLPPETVVPTGHGESTTIGAEAPHLQDWIDRGH